MYVHAYSGLAFASWYLHMAHMYVGVQVMQAQEPSDKEQWQVLQDWLWMQAPAPVLIALENAEQCVALPEDDLPSVPLREVGQLCIHTFISLAAVLSQCEHIATAIHMLVCRLV
jgi:hypothetical protein